MPSVDLDLYAVLGVKPSSTEEHIRQAYRDLAKANHPDAGGSAEAMADLNEAYRVLSDPAARRRYDDDILMDAKAPTPEYSPREQVTPEQHHADVAAAASAAAEAHREQNAAARRYVLSHLEEFGWLALLAGVALSYLAVQPNLSRSGWMLGILGFACLYWVGLQVAYLVLPDYKISNYQTARAPHRADRRHLVRLIATSLAWVPLGVIWVAIIVHSPMLH
jgi:hypothetical protein